MKAISAGLEKNIFYNIYPIRKIFLNVASQCEILTEEGLQFTGLADTAGLQ